MLDAFAAAAIAEKAFLYAVTLACGGSVIFLAIFGAQLAENERAWLLGAARAFAIAALVATIARLPILAAMLGGDWSGAWDTSDLQIVLEGSEGRAAIVRVVGLVVVAASTFTFGFRQALALAGAVIAIVSFALTGHTGSLGMGIIPGLILAAHLLAIAYWLGALLPLFRLAASRDNVRVGALLRQFGRLAVGFVGTLVSVGLLLLWLLIGSVEALLTSDYGRLVLSKLAVVAALLGLAAINKLRLTPAVERSEPNAASRLRWSIAGEMLAVAAILVITATFTTVTGPPQLE